MSEEEFEGGLPAISDRDIAKRQMLALESIAASLAKMMMQKAYPLKEVLYGSEKNG